MTQPRLFLVAPVLQAVNLAACLEAACEAVYEHGLLADQWPDNLPLLAAELARQRCAIS